MLHILEIVDENFIILILNFKLPMSDKNWTQSNKNNHRVELFNSYLIPSLNPTTQPTTAAEDEKQQKFEYFFLISDILGSKLSISKWKNVWLITW